MCAQYGYVFCLIRRYLVIRLRKNFLKLFVIKRKQKQPAITQAVDIRQADNQILLQGCQALNFRRT